MKQKAKNELFTSRPEPPTLEYIASDIFLAGGDDPVFDVLKRSRSGLENGSSDGEFNSQYLNQASDFMKKMKQLQNLDYLREMSKEFHALSSELSEVNKLGNGSEDLKNK